MGHEKNIKFQQFHNLTRPVALRLPDISLSLGGVRTAIDYSRRKRSPPIV